VIPGGLTGYVQCVDVFIVAAMRVEMVKLYLAKCRLYSERGQAWNASRRRNHLVEMTRVAHEHVVGQRDLVKYFAHVGYLPLWSEAGEYLPTVQPESYSGPKTRFQGKDGVVFVIADLMRKPTSSEDALTVRKAPAGSQNLRHMFQKCHDDNKRRKREADERSSQMSQQMSQVTSADLVERSTVDLTQEDEDEEAAEEAKAIALVAAHEAEEDEYFLEFPCGMDFESPQDLGSFETPQRPTRRTAAPATGAHNPAAASLTGNPAPRPAQRNALYTPLRRDTKRTRAALQCGDDDDDDDDEHMPAPAPRRAPFQPPGPFRSSKK
jgi:hypothetical protein